MKSTIAIQTKLAIMTSERLWPAGIETGRALNEGAI